MKTTHPTDPMPFNEWAIYIRRLTDLEYNVKIHLNNKTKCKRIN